MVLNGARHGCNVRHADEFNAALVSFLGRYAQASAGSGLRTIRSPGAAGA